jgi:redox-sensing transcriptional repressor
VLGNLLAKQLIKLATDEHGRNFCSKLSTSELKSIEFVKKITSTKRTHPAAIIPKKTVYRLSIYLRCLQRLKENSIRTVSSEALAKVAGVKSTQLRKDLTFLGHFGTRGLGYDVQHLSTKITESLGTNRLQPVVLVGVGSLGSALLAYKGFEQEGFEIVGAFDADTSRKRSKDFDKPILPMTRLKEVVRQFHVRLGIIAVPASAAHEAAHQLIDAGITAILNFAPTVLHVPEDVMVNNVNLASELENLSYFVQMEH